MFADFSGRTLPCASCTCGHIRCFFSTPNVLFWGRLSCSIKCLSDARLDCQQWERSGQIQHHISFEQLQVGACGWALSVSVSPAAPNYRQQWHHTVSGLSAEIMRGPIPGARAPVRVSGFLSSNHLWWTGRSTNSCALSLAGRCIWCCCRQMKTQSGLL